MHTAAHAERLLAYARAKGLLQTTDLAFARNMLLCALGLDALDEETTLDTSPLPETPGEILEHLCDAAAARNKIEDTAESRAIFADCLMNLLTPAPSFAQAEFARREQAQGTRAALDWFYDLCRANASIRVDQIARNVHFDAPCAFGALEITINLAKPEKDPRDIASQKDLPAIGYPRCMLCIENEGYAGRIGYAPHATLRTLPLTLGGDPWRLQFSPYAYYEQHCIALNELHTPMVIDRRTFALLLDFVNRFPDYFIGSNADLPIVGGSILGHEHFQGGLHHFPMDKAPAYAGFTHPDYPSVAGECVRWPLSCLRLMGANRDALIDLANKVLTAWRAYDDPEMGVLHATDATPHNTITPIARRLPDGQYQLQLVLRNNRATAEHPLGIFHPHDDLHHIKRENIGLIEVMGLMVLPGRLRDELAGLAAFLTGERPLMPPAADDTLSKHYDWICELAARKGTALTQSAAEQVLREALGARCVRVLSDCGVFPATPAGDRAMARFLALIGANAIHPA
ncbi:MAG: UDP-glucose--hexose-1-phosphate uridylyltransferase [Oscillospiraceae bacterium]|jgi:UDPglucose--hexose-1-phosphate uridylyltransferase|nr:UDP-glucose--hexose-1-phosphate uridylyltransferase [Oscillospiraceae bacterium]